MRKPKLNNLKLKGNLAPGRHYDQDGTGLHIYVRKSGSKAWVQRIRINGKYVDIGLGNYPSITLSKAREIARNNKTLAIEGKDPRLVTARPKKTPTFAECAAAVIANKAEELSNAKHRAQWASTLATYATPKIGDMPIDQIEVDQILNVLRPIWLEKNETAKRVRGRLEAVFDYAIARKMRSPPNPAVWKGNLSELLPKRSRSSRVVHQPALQLGDASRWWHDLLQRDGMGAKALQFLALSACRSGEVRGMKWSEIQQPSTAFDVDFWIIPAARMKARKEHRVPLTFQMRELLNSIPRHKTSEIVFHSKRGAPLSDATLNAIMKRMHESAQKEVGEGYVDSVSERPAVPHGLRSTFRNWTADQGYDSDLAELQLAHEVGTKVSQAYMRSDMVERRLHMLNDWATFLATKGCSKQHNK